MQSQLTNFSIQDDWSTATGRPRPGNATWQPRPSLPLKSQSASTLQHGSSIPNGTSLALESGENSPNLRNAFDRVYLNAAGQRVDVPQELNIDSNIESQIKAQIPHLCNSYSLFGQCINPDQPCRYEHETTLSEKAFEALLRINRGTRCLTGGRCRLRHCMKGHMCSAGRNCRFGTECRFSDLHNIDTVVSEEIPGIQFSMEASKE